MANIFAKLGEAITNASNNFGRAMDKLTAPIGNGITGFIKGSVKSIPGAATGALAGIGGGVPGIIAGAIAGGAPTVIKETIGGITSNNPKLAPVVAAMNNLAGGVGQAMATQGGTVGNVGQAISAASGLVSDALVADKKTPPVVSGGVEIELPNGGSVTIGGSSGSSSGGSSGSVGSSGSSSGDWRETYNGITDALLGSVPIEYPFQRKG